MLPSLKCAVMRPRDQFNEFNFAMLRQLMLVFEFLSWSFQEDVQGLLFLAVVLRTRLKFGKVHFRTCAIQVLDDPSLAESLCRNKEFLVP